MRYLIPIRSSKIGYGVITLESKTIKYKDGATRTKNINKNFVRL